MAENRAQDEERAIIFKAGNLDFSNPFLFGLFYYFPTLTFLFLSYLDFSILFLPKRLWMEKS